MADLLEAVGGPQAPLMGGEEAWWKLGDTGKEYHRLVLMGTAANWLLNPTEVSDPGHAGLGGGRRQDRWPAVEGQLAGCFLCWCMVRVHGTAQNCTELHGRDSSCTDAKVLPALHNYGAYSSI